jgi:hypothetical protein
MVLEDLLEERGWARIPLIEDQDRNHWELSRGGISEAQILWFSSEFFATHNYTDRRSGETLSFRVTYDSDQVDPPISVSDKEMTRQFDNPEIDLEVDGVPGVLRLLDRVDACMAEIDAQFIPRPKGVPEGMRRPGGLSDAGNLAYDILLAFFKKHRLTYTGGCTTFRAPSSRYEYAGNAELVVVYEGSEVKRAMSLDGYDYALNEKMQRALELGDMYFEEGASWYGGVYLRRFPR